jgi:hypothetical protein
MFDSNQWTRLLLITLSVGLLGCASMERHVRRVSLIRLIACPEKYDHKEVWVEGYCTTGFENGFLFLTKEHAVNFIVESAVALGFSKSLPIETDFNGLSGKWVSVHGVFYREAGSLFVPMGGAIRDIDQIDELKSAVGTHDQGQ